MSQIPVSNPIKANMLFVATLLCILMNSNANIYEAANFTDTKSNGFNHMTVHRDTGDVYIGGVNQLYRLNGELELKNNVSTRPNSEQEQKDTHNKILAINYDSNLVTCDSYRGTCQLRDLQDLSVTKNGAGVFVTSVSPDESTVGFVAPNPDDPFLYVGTTSVTTGDGREPGDPFVSGRQLDDTRNELFDVLDEGSDDETSVKVHPGHADSFPVRYVTGFSHGRYSYFLTSQLTSTSITSPYISKLVRVCQTARDYRYKSYTEVTLKCKDEQYNLAQAAYLTRPAGDLIQSLALGDSEKVLFVAFAKGVDDPPVPTTESAICMYKMSVIEEAFKDAAAGCLTSRKPGGPASWINGALCPRSNIDFPPNQECFAGSHYSYANGVVDQDGYSVEVYPSTLVTSIAVTTVEQHTVGFLGTDRDWILKLHFVSESYANTYEEIIFTNSTISKVLPDMMFDGNEEHFYMVSGSSVRKMKVEACSQYTTCEDCFESMDPYCGWCNLDRRCSIVSNCTRAYELSRWLHSFNNSLCVEIASIEPEEGIPVNVTHRIILNMIELPEVDDGNVYSCNYDGYFNTTGEKDGLKLKCDTPPLENRPEIPAGEDHVTIQLYVRSSETDIDFVNKDFHFYDCSVHKSCSACVTSNWACNWCVYENRCTHYLDSCPHDDSESIVIGDNNTFNGTSTNITAQSYCPQLVNHPGEVLIPVSVDREIKLNTLNIYDNQGYGEYECVLMVEDGPQSIRATRHNETSVTCNMQKYNYQAYQQEMNVRLTLKWNGNYIIDDMHGFTVTLYNCSIDRRDCSECLSKITTRLPLKCGWCEDSGDCEVEETCTSQEWWNYTTTNNCALPNVTEVWPLSGPYEGGTEIIINGTDLGKSIDDIISVTVADLPCEYMHLEDRYVVSKGIECNTSANIAQHSGDVKVTVRANDGSFQVTENAKQFTYRDPRILDFTPKIGPKSGGTIVTITGDYVDAGREIKAYFGGFPCDIDRMKDVLNETQLLCNTTSANITNAAEMTMNFDGSVRDAPEGRTFKVTEDPTVTYIDPSESMMSGGRTINVTGTFFKSIQEPRMLITAAGQPFVSDDPCVVFSNERMQCISPPVELPDSRRIRRQTNYTLVTVGFIMDAVVEVLRLEDFEFEVAVDPEYFPFEEDDNIKIHGGEQLVIEGKNLDLASTKYEVFVTIGQENCTVVSLSDVQLNCVPPEKAPGGVNITGSPTERRLPEVRVEVGNLIFTIGYLQYPEEGPIIPLSVIIGIAAAAGLLIIVIITILIVFQRRVKSKDREFQRLEKKAEQFEQDVKIECKRAFAELQTDMSSVTKDILDSGVPFLDFNNYAVNMMFAGQSDHPVLKKNAEIPSGSHKRGLEEFYSLLANKAFCLVFIRTLEEQRMTVKDKVNVGSLLTIILQKERKMSYLTEILTTLIAQAAVEAEEDDRTKSMLRRTESIMEKMLTNWFLVTLYPFIKICAGEPIFMLFKAMKYQIDKGPMDALEGLAKYSLTDKFLLRHNFEPDVLTVNVVTSEDGRSEAQAKILDVDTISQVKDKLLDVIYKNHAYSKRPSVEEIDVEWRGGREGQGRLVLEDEDMTSEVIGQWKRLNTVKHYQVPDGATLALVKKSDIANGGIRTPIIPPSEYDFYQFHDPDVAPEDNKDEQSKRNDDEEEGSGIKRWHLIKVRGAEKKRKNLRERALTRAKSMYRPERVISEIFLLQLVSTKGTIQDFVQHVFDALLTLDKQQYPMFPPPVKYMFDFLDSLADKHGDGDEDVAHIWKSNSLPLRIWAIMLKCPNFVFDIKASPTVIASLDIVAQTFIDACSKVERKLGVQSPAVKLLYARELVTYKEMVDTYYNDIKDLPSVSDSQLSSYMEENFLELGGGKFNRMVALNELYKYATKYGDRILDALENDEACQKTHLAFQLEQVSATMAENDYQAYPGEQSSVEEPEQQNAPTYEVNEVSDQLSAKTDDGQQKSEYEVMSSGKQQDEYELADMSSQQEHNETPPAKPAVPQKPQHQGFSYGIVLPKSQV